MSWTEEDRALAVRLDALGASTADVAQALGGRYSRNAIIGHFFRLRQKAKIAGDAPGDAPLVKTATPVVAAPPPPDPITTSTAPAAAAAPPRFEDACGGEPEGLPTQELAPAAPVRRLPRPADGLVSLLALENNLCHWPVGDPRHNGFGFCGAGGADVIGGRPYCGGATVCLRYRTTEARAARAA